MNTRPIACVTLLVLAATGLCARTAVGKGTAVSFASVEEGKQILTSRDEFVEQMSPFERALRMKTNRDVSEGEYLEFVGRNVLEWTDGEKERIENALLGVRETIDEMGLPFPSKILLIKTSGREECRCPYTRANAIALPQPLLGRSDAVLQEVVAHELFHILSRANPELRDRLYAAIGYERCGEVSLPPELEARRITNPDAPRNEHCIRVSVAGHECWAVPILFSPLEEYDAAERREFVNYLQSQFLLGERLDDGSLVASQETLVDIGELSGYWEQVGRYTGYMDHPEEIVAVCFQLLVLGQRETTSPEVLEKIEAILKAVRQGPAS